MKSQKPSQNKTHHVYRVFRCFPIEHKAQLLREASQLQKQCTVCQKPNSFALIELTNSSTWPSKIQHSVSTQQWTWRTINILCISFLLNDQIIISSSANIKNLKNTSMLFGISGTGINLDFPIFTLSISAMTLIITLTSNLDLWSTVDKTTESSLINSWY